MALKIYYQFTQISKILAVLILQKHTTQFITCFSPILLGITRKTDSEDSESNPDEPKIKKSMKSCCCFRICKKKSGYDSNSDNESMDEHEHNDFEQEIVNSSNQPNS